MSDSEEKSFSSDHDPSGSDIYTDIDIEEKTIYKPSNYIPVSIDNIDDDDTSSITDIFNKAPLIFAEKLEWIVMRLVFPFYTALAISSLALIIIYFVPVLFPNLLSLAIVLCITICGSITGAILTYKYGTLETIIDSMGVENDKYSETVVKLRDTAGILKIETKNVQTSVDSLSLESKTLDTNLDAFVELRESLNEIGSEHETIFDMIEEINKQYSDMNDIIIENERAHLWSIYYSVEFEDDQSGLSKDEYEEFCMQLNVETRDLFEKLGGFEIMDIDKSGDISVEEFQIMLGKVIDATEAKMLQNSMAGAEI